MNQLVAELKAQLEHIKAIRKDSVWFDDKIMELQDLISNYESHAKVC